MGELVLMNTTFDNYTGENAAMKSVELSLLTLSLGFSSIAVNANWESLLVAIGGSFSGSIVLAYFRRDSRKVEQMFKTLCSSICGLVLGAALQEYLIIEGLRYSLLLYFFSGLLSLALLRGLLSATEQNAAMACKHLLQRIFNLQLENERRRPSDEGRQITFEHTKQPNKKRTVNKS